MTGLKPHEIHEVKYEETVNKQRIPSGQGLIGATAYWTQKTAKEVQGTNNSNGTQLLSVDIPAGYVFVCSILQFACNEGRTIAVCTVDDGQSLGHSSQTEYYTLGSDNKGFYCVKGEEQPIFIVDNSGSSDAIDLKVYAPHTVFNTTNDPNTSYFNAFIGGLLYKGAVATRGES